MRLRWWVLIILLVGSHFGGYSPFGALFSLTGQIWGTLRSNGAPTTPEDSLSAAIRNVTSDYDQLTDILKEFFKQTERTDPHAEEHFRYFLQERADRSHAKLEKILDWLLAIYKIAFPFLVCLMVAKVSGSGRQAAGGEDAQEHIKAVYVRSSSGHLKHQKEYSPPLSPLLETGSTPYSRTSSSQYARQHSGHSLLEHSKSRARSGSDLAMRASGF